MALCTFSGKTLATSPYLSTAKLILSAFAGCSASLPCNEEEMQFFCCLLLLILMICITALFRRNY